MKIYFSHFDFKPELFETSDILDLKEYKIILKIHQYSNNDYYFYLIKNGLIYKGTLYYKDKIILNELESLFTYNKYKVTTDLYELNFKFIDSNYIKMKFNSNLRDLNDDIEEIEKYKLELEEKINELNNQIEILNKFK